jgi:uncharacterized membrane protein YeaQ/YmgE (transglycosylase-associated protein family)
LFHGAGTPTGDHHSLKATAGQFGRSILTTVLGIIGAFFSTWIGQTIGWYRPDQGAGLIAATLGAIAVLFIWNRLVANGVINDPGNPR